MINEIFDFNRKALGVQPKPVPQLEYKHANFCVTAIGEECMELQDAQCGKSGNPNVPIVYADPSCEAARMQTVESVDALIDAAYFAIGGLARAGLTPEQAIDCFLAVHEANMQKKLGVKESRGDMGVADAVKPADWVGPEQRIYEILFGEK